MSARHGRRSSFRARGPHALGDESLGFGGHRPPALGAGFVAIRKGDGLFPAPKHAGETPPDYRGVRHELRIQRDAVARSDRVLLVDDWIERGSHASCARELLEGLGASLVGITVIVDQLDDALRRSLPPLRAILEASELSRAS